MATDSTKLTIIEHLTELRKRLTIIAIVTVISTLLCYQFVNVFMDYILALNTGMDLIYITPSELFLVYVKLAMTFGIILSSPISLTQIWMFISKGLYKREKIYIVTSLMLGITFFILGAYFCYEVVLPTTLSFFINIAVPGIRPMISIDSFVSFISTMLVGFGIVFEMPVVILFLSLIGLVTPKFLMKQHPIFVLGIFICAAFITPPDVVSLLFLAIPMVLLFELSIGLSWIVSLLKKKKTLKHK